MKVSNSFSASLLLSMVMLLAANAWFLFANHNIPDGRISFILPVTSVFVMLCAFYFGTVSNKVLGKGGSYLMTVYTAIVSVLFVLFAHSAQFVHTVPESLLMVPRVGLIPFSSYLIVFGLGMAIYPMLTIAARKSSVNDVAKITL